MLLLDIRMPKVNGVEVLRQLKSSNELRKLPVIMLTTTDDPREVMRCHELGCSAYIQKPVDASFVDVPRQRNHRAQNATIKAGLSAVGQAGAVPHAWAERPAKQRQKDVDARWTKKNAEVHYGYKNHVKADAQSKS